MSNCDCCRREVLEVHVRSSAVGPISFGYCIECLQNGAEPEWTFHHLYDMISRDGEGLADWVKSLNTYKDGKYVSWDDWVIWRKTEPQKTIFDEKHRKDMEKLGDG